MARGYDTREAWQIGLLSQEAENHDEVELEAVGRPAAIASGSHDPG